MIGAQRSRPCATFLVAALLLALPGTLRAQDVAIPLGGLGPDAAVQDLEGRAIQLRSLFISGRPTVLEFWATWCGECEALQPQFDQIQARFGTRVRVIAVAVGVAQTLRRVNQHLEDHNPGYPFVWDANGAAVRAYEVPVTSTVVILDRQGRVVYTGVDRSQNVIAAVEKVLATP
jgi:thiol-disulfide isomerase/thioredoxin